MNKWLALIIWSVFTIGWLGFFTYNDYNKGLIGNKDMRISELKEMFESGDKLYAEKVKESGMTRIPFCWAKNEQSGQLVIYTPFGKDADEIMKRLKTMK